MSSGVKTSTLALVALLAAVAGAVTGTLIWVTAQQDMTGVPITEQGECRPGPAFLKAVEELKSDQAQMREELNALRVSAADLQAQTESLAGKPADGNLRASLPPPFVELVDNFFLSPEARSLLSAKAQKRRSIRFDKPSFLSPNTIAVPYSIAEKDYYLVVSIKILDYYDLQFDVIWDSMEGE